MKNAALILTCVTVLAAPWPIGGNYPFVRTAVILLAVTMVGLAIAEIFHRRLHGSRKNSPEWTAVFFNRSLFAPTGWVWWVAPAALAYAWFQLTQSSGPISILPSNSASQFFVLASAWAIFFASSVLNANPKNLEAFMFCATLVGVAVAFVGILQTLQWNGKVLWCYDLLHGGKPFGPFVNKNNAAGFMIIAMTGAVYFSAKTILNRNVLAATGTNGFDQANHRKRDHGIRYTILKFLVDLQVRDLYCLTAVVTILAGVLLSLSRGGAFSLIFALSVATAMIAARRRVVLGLAVLAAIVCVATTIWLEQADVVSSAMVSVADREQPVNARLLHWQDATPYYQHFWKWGSGLGSYRFAYAEFQQHPFARKFAHAENVYLETLAELGLPGVISLFLVIVGLAAKSIALYRGTTNQQRALGIAGSFLMAGLCASASLDFGIYQPANFWLAAMALGAIYGSPTQAQRSTKATLASDLGRVFLLASLLVVCVVGVLPSAASESAQFAKRQIDLHVHHQGRQSTRLPVARGALEFAETHLPNDWQIQYLLGQLNVFEHRKIAATQLMNQTDPELRRQALADGLTADQIQKQLPTFEDYWTATSLSQVHRAARLAQRQQLTEYIRMRNDDSFATPKLREAHRRFHAALKRCPQSEKVYFRLAQLTPLFEPQENNLEIEKEFAEKALSLSKGFSGMAYDVGLLALSSGAPETTARLWAQCLQQSRQFERPIVYFSSELPVKLFFEKVLPQIPNELLRISRIYFSQPEQKLPNELLLVHTRRVIQAAGLPAAEQSALLGKSYLQANDFKTASQHFATALEQTNDSSWRFDYATTLGEIGQFDAAIEQLNRCRLESPELRVPASRQIEKLRRRRSRRLGLRSAQSN